MPVAKSRGLRIASPNSLSKNSAKCFVLSPAWCWAFLSFCSSASFSWLCCKTHTLVKMIARRCPRIKNHRTGIANFGRGIFLPAILRDPVRQGRFREIFVCGLPAPTLRNFCGCRITYNERFSGTRKSLCRRRFRALAPISHLHRLGLLPHADAVARIPTTLQMLAAAKHFGSSATPVAILSRAVLVRHESSCGDNGAVYLSPRARDFLSGVFKEMSSRHASSADGKGRSVP